MDVSFNDVLIRLFDAVGNARSLDDIYDAAMTGIREATGVDRASILLFDPDGVMRFKSWSGISDAYRAAVEGHTPWHAGAPVPDPIVVRDVTHAPDLAAYAETFAGERIRALAFIPIVSCRRVIGKFMLYRQEPVGFTGREVTAAVTIGYQIGFAVERTRREVEHDEQHQRLLFALDAAQMGAWEWDLRGPTPWSAQLARMHGLPAGTCTSSGTSDADIHPEDRPRVLASLERAIRDPDARHDVEYRIVAPDGTVQWVHGKGRVDRAADGRATRMTGVCMDIGDRKRAEAEIAQAFEYEAALRERLGVLTDGAQRLLSSLSTESVAGEILTLARSAIAADAYAIWRRHDEEWRVAASYGLSDAYIASVLQYDNPVVFDQPVVAEDVMRLPLLQHRQDAYAREGIRSLVTIPLTIRGEPGGCIVFYYRTPHAPSEIDLRVATALAQMGAAAIHNADLHASQQELYRGMQEANRLKDEFLATLSHELRTPLNVILGRVRMLAQTPDLPESLRQTTDTIERNASVLSRLVEDLLDISRITLGQVTLDPQPLDLPALVRSVALGVEPAARARGITLLVDAVPDLPPLVGDATRLQQVVWNLLSNAIKFTPAGGRVTATLQYADGHLHLAVRDTGEGIAPSFLPCLFEMFRQAEATTNRRHGGLGLGLSIVRRLVELHGGTVAASSDGIGCGSTFDVRLPCPLPAPATLPEAMDASVRPQPLA